MKTAPLLLLPALLAAPALADERFEAMRKGAEPLESLAGFVERYVGSCRDPMERASCEANVKANRKAMDGRLFATILDERARELIRVERRPQGFRFLVTGPAFRRRGVLFAFLFFLLVGFILIVFRRRLDVVIVGLVGSLGFIFLNVVFLGEFVFRFQKHRAR